MNNFDDVTRRGDVKSLKRILAANPNFLRADVPKFTSFLRTPLHVAAICGYVDFASEILNRNPELATEVDSQGFTPLHLASTGNNVEMVKLLLSRNRDACLVLDKYGGTPLHLAAMNNERNTFSLPIMELLIQRHPAAIHRVLGKTDETVLHLCVKHDNLKALEKLVDYLVFNRVDFANNQAMISVNSVDRDGNTILHLAAQKKRMRMLDYLLASNDIGVDLNIVNNEGLTALHMLDRSDMTRIGITCYDYQNACEVQPQSTTSDNEWVKERLNMIMIVAALIAGIAYQSLINPPGGVFQEDSKIDSITDPVMFTYYLKNVIGNHAMSQGFQSYLNNLPPQITATGNITADEIVTYRANFVKDLLAAAKSSESLVRSVFPSFYLSNEAPGIVLEDAWWMNITSKYNTTYGGGSGFSPYLIRYAGTAILAYRSPRLYEVYVVLNMVSLGLCSVTIGAISFDIKFHLIFEVITVIAVVCIFASSKLVADIINPPFYVFISRDKKILVAWFGSTLSPIFAALIFVLVLKVVDHFCIKKRFGVQPFFFENRIDLYYGPIIKFIVVILKMFIIFVMLFALMSLSN